MLSCRSARGSATESMLSGRLTAGNHLNMFQALHASSPTFADQGWWSVQVQMDMAGNTGSVMGMGYWFAGIPHKVEFLLRTGFSFGNGKPSILDGGCSLVRLGRGSQGVDGHLPVRGCFPPFFLLDILHVEMALCFYHSCSTTLPALASKQTGGWTSFFSLHPQDSGVLTSDGMLVFNDCMEWANIPRWDGDLPGLARLKDSFSFTYQGQTVPLVALKRGWLLLAVIIRDFPYSNLPTVNPHSPYK